MTLTQYLREDGVIPGSIQSITFTADVVKIKNCKWEDKTTPPGDYWIEKISRMGNDENPYYKLELRQDISNIGHHTATTPALEEIYCCAGDFDKFTVEVK